MIPVLEITIGRDDAGQRLDRFLRKFLPSATLGHVFKLIRTGKVKVNGRKSRPEAWLEEGDELVVGVPDERLAELSRPRRGSRSAPESRSREALRVLHRDAHVLAVDKPPFLLVQPGEKPDEPTLEDLVRDLVGPVDALTFRPSLAHRLDRGTSGVVLFGVSAEGLRGLTGLFRRREIDKRYLALVAGDPAEDAFVVDAPLLRADDAERGAPRMRVSSASGSLSAETEVEVRGRARGFALVEARPRTGRTHQVRVHLRSRGLPIVGDPVYGDPAVNRAARAEAGLWRPFLHAASLRFRHPVVKAGELEIASPLPDDLSRALAWAGIGLEPTTGDR